MAAAAAVDLYHQKHQEELGANHNAVIDGQLAARSKIKGKSLQGKIAQKQKQKFKVFYKAQLKTAFRVFHIYPLWPPPNAKKQYSIVTLLIDFCNKKR